MKRHLLGVSGREVSTYFRESYKKRCLIFLNGMELRYEFVKHQYGYFSFCIGIPAHQMYVKGKHIKVNLGEIALMAIKNLSSTKLYQEAYIYT